jgi:tetratricopeptide (TPR) repeat protein
MRGDYGRAVGSYTMALAAFQQADLHWGIAQVMNNLSITYRDQGDLVKALSTADDAVEEAQAAGNLRLAAATRAGRAEVRLLSGDAEFARREVERVLESEGSLGNVVGEAEDLRVLAGAQAALGETEEAEKLLREVVERAESLERPHLAAQAERDLARLLMRLGRTGEAQELARKARVRFERLGAAAEVQKLDDFMSNGASG